MVVGGVPNGVIETIDIEYDVVDVGCGMVVVTLGRLIVELIVVGDTSVKDIDERCIAVKDVAGVVLRIPRAVDVGITSVASTVDGKRFDVAKVCLGAMRRLFVSTSNIPISSLGPILS